MSRKDVENESFVRRVQELLRESLHPSLAVDGWAGRKTVLAFESTFGALPAYHTEAWPEDADEALNDFYGPRGTGFELMPLPYPMRLAWDHGTTIHRAQCHFRVRDSLTSILEEILAHYGSLEEVRAARMDLFGGICKVRPMRGNSSRWSRHSWGCAIDLDPRQNGLTTPWPSEATMPEAVVRIFERHGWKSYARSLGLDAMHFQATR